MSAPAPTLCGPVRSWRSARAGLVLVQADVGSAGLPLHVLGTAGIGRRVLLVEARTVQRRLQVGVVAGGVGFRVLAHPRAVPVPAGAHYNVRMRAILSDLDGTLIDSTPAVLRVWAGWRAERGVAAGEHPHGIPSKQTVRILAPHLDAEAEARELERREIEDVDGVVALPGAEELLTAPPLPLAIVTSCTLALAEARLRAVGLWDQVPAQMVTSERTELVKPDPDPYLLGAELLGIAPADCVVLEDAPAGIAAGRSAGMRVVAVRSTHADDALTGADDVVDDVAAFLASLR